MRKGITEAMKATTVLTARALDNLWRKGFRFVQVKGLDNDRHYDYMEPGIMVLVPMRELPTDPLQKDIYEPINSRLLYQWAAEKNDHLQMLIADSHVN
jgi:hypothetical protein